MDLSTITSFDIKGLITCNCTIHSIEKSVDRSYATFEYTYDPLTPGKCTIIPGTYKADQSFVQTCLYVKITMDNIPTFTLDGRTYSFPETILLDCYESARDHFGGKVCNKPALYNVSIDVLRQNCIGSDQPCFMLPATCTDEFGRLPVLIACSKMVSYNSDTAPQSKLQNNTLEDLSKSLADLMDNFYLHGFHYAIPTNLS